MLLVFEKLGLSQGANWRSLILIDGKTHLNELGELIAEKLPDLFFKFKKEHILAVLSKATSCQSVQHHTQGPYVCFACSIQSCLFTANFVTFASCCLSLVCLIGLFLPVKQLVWLALAFFLATRDRWSITVRLLRLQLRSQEKTINACDFLV